MLRERETRGGHFSVPGYFIPVTLMAAQPETWHYRICARTGWPAVSILGLGEIASSICGFCLELHGS